MFFGPFSTGWAIQSEKINWIFLDDKSKDYQ